MAQHFKVTIPQDVAQTDMQKRAEYIAAQLNTIFHRDDITATPVTDERHVTAINDHIESVGDQRLWALSERVSADIETMDAVWERIKGAWGQIST